MSQATPTLRSMPRPSFAPLPGIPRQPLTPEQQLEAVRRVQAQAEQRVKLGVQLFKAAEANTSSHRQLLDEVKAEQSRFRTEIQSDVSKSLESYDLAMEKMEDDLTGKLRVLEDKIAQLQNDWQKAQGKIAGMLKRSEAMLEQGRGLVEGDAGAARVPSISPTRVEVREDASVAGGEPPAGEALNADARTPIYRQVIAKLREREDTPPAA